MSLSLLETANSTNVIYIMIILALIKYPNIFWTVVLMLYRPNDSSVDGGNVRIESFPKCCFTRDTSTFKKRKKEKSHHI